MKRLNLLLLALAALTAVYLKADNSYVIPPPGGGGGNPGGSSSQLQYNNAGSFGGIPGATWDGTTLTLPAVSNSSPTIANAAANTIPYTNASKQLVGTAGDFFYDATNHYVGMGTVSPSYDFDIRRNRNGVPVGIYSQNQHSGGDAVYAAANDTSGLTQIGIGGTGFPAPYANNGFITSTADFVFLPASGKSVYTSPAGRGFGVTEGSNAKMGTFNLASGVAWVPNTSVTANSRIFLTVQTRSGTSTGIGVTSTTVNTGFNAFGAVTDNSTVAYVIFEAY